MRRISFSRSVKPGSPGTCSPFGTSPRMRAISRVVAPGSSIDWQEATVRTAVTRSVPVICFRTWPAAPAITASRSASSSSNDVSIRQASSGIRERSSRHTLTPSPSWSRTSRIATRGRSAGMRTSACSAVPASSTTVRSGSASNRSCTPLRTTSWSSSKKMLMGSVAPLALVAWEWEPLPVMTQLLRLVRPERTNTGILPSVRAERTGPIGLHRPAAARGRAGGGRGGGTFGPVRGPAGPSRGHPTQDELQVHGERRDSTEPHAARRTP